MTEKKKLFRRIFDAMIEGREAHAQRFIEEHLRQHGRDGKGR
jgi:DNA-binding FadR family transcriptional regulator